MPAPALNQSDLDLADAVSEFYSDPLGFVLFAYPWGEPGPLERFTGPDVWQREFLERLGQQVRARRFDGQLPVAPIRMAVSSGHGVGKSTLAAWLVGWIMATRPKSRGTITANTYIQLRSKTWASIAHWHHLSITKHWFQLNTDRLYKPEEQEREDWFCQAQSCAEENSEAFAGQHSAGSTSFYIFDEASAVPDKIHEVAEGGLIRGEPMIFLFGNPTRISGAFHRACFGDQRKRWDVTIVDSRESTIFPNPEQIAEWIQDYGEDSDFVRVRVRGLPPNASDAQFIDTATVHAAQKRDVQVLDDEPLIAGCDLAWGGSDDNVIRFRRGLDARSIPSIRIKGEFTRNPDVLTNRLADVLTRDFNGRKVAMLFLDSAGIAGPISRRLRDLGHANVTEINFGADSPDPKYVYFRDYMWGMMRDWLRAGAIDAHPELEVDLTGPGVVPDNRQRVKLESKKDMKKRGLDSPDDADALCLTWAMPVASAHVVLPRGGISFGGGATRPKTGQSWHRRD